MSSRPPPLPRAVHVHAACDVYIYHTHDHLCSVLQRQREVLREALKKVSILVSVPATCTSAWTQGCFACIGELFVTSASQVFDVDGVLVDDGLSYKEAIKQTAARWGVAVTDETIDLMKVVTR